jgi:concanavalin A-like lectin/glucanase superfamily protein
MEQMRVACAILVVAIGTGCDVVFRLDDVRGDGIEVDAAVDAVVDGLLTDPRVLARFDFEGSFVDAKSGLLAACLIGSGCPTFKHGLHGIGVEFDGADDCVKFMLPSNPTQLTVAVWMDKYTDTAQSVVSKPFADTNSDSFQIDIDSNRTVRFVTYNGSGDRILIQPTAFAIGTWQHVAVTFDFNKKIFTNGVIAPNVAIAETMVSDASALLIGCDHETNTYARYFAGMLDEVIVYNVALTTEEVASLAQP